MSDEVRSARVQSGVPGMDLVLEGGLLRGGLYAIVGGPGTGKTLLANQISFNHVRSGGKVVYLTLLSESHSRMIRNIREFRFSDEKLVGDGISYLSGAHALDSGLPALLQLLQQVLLDHRATLLVIDGLTGPSLRAADLAFPRFLYELQVFAESRGCTILLLTSDHNPESEAAQTAADGILVLSNLEVGLRSVREIHVAKYRGSAFLDGRHLLRVTDEGIAVYPRRERLLSSLPPCDRVDEPPSRKCFGLDVLDGMIGGGLPAGSATVLRGPTGTGKTLLGLRFLATGAQSNEPGLVVGFRERPSLLRQKAAWLGWQPGSPGVADIEIMWRPPFEQMVDAVGEAVVGAVKRLQVRRLLLDDVNGLQSAAVYPHRVQPFLAALLEELFQMGVTTILTALEQETTLVEETKQVSGIAGLVENVIDIRRELSQERLARLLSILKMRDSHHDERLSRLNISQSGLQVSHLDELADSIVIDCGSKVTAERQRREL
jgi:circadian clock protein KaiC